MFRYGLLDARVEVEDGAGEGDRDANRCLGRRGVGECIGVV